MPSGIAEPDTTRRKSKNRPAGVPYDRDVTMTSERYISIMTTKVFPTIVKAFAGTGIMKVTVQQDGAKPHTGQDAVKKMNAIGAKLTPAITVITQPAQSPDFNVNDLAFFRALDVRVRKLRRGKGNSFDKDVLVRDVEAAHAEFASETIERMFAYKEKVMDHGCRLKATV